MRQTMQGGFHTLVRAGGRHPVATVFPTRDIARTAIIANREYCRHLGLDLPPERYEIVRLVS
jgi:hypothetical protein